MYSDYMYFVRVSLKSFFSSSNLNEKDIDVTDQQCQTRFHYEPQKHYDGPQKGQLN